jgi:dienelactone hydrolase
VNFTEWYQELRRRRVIRTLIGWGLASFAVLQVIEPVIHAYHLPDWTLTVVVSLLGVGFPVAAVLAWVFDLTSRGITRTQPLGPSAAAGAPAAAEVVVRRRTIALFAAGLVIAVAGTGWYLHRESRARWALEEALPQVVELVDRSRFAEAVALAEQVERVVPDHPKLLKLWPAMSRRFDVETEPAGAQLSVKPYGATDEAWRRLGASPLKEVRLPLGLHQWRIERPGFTTVDAVPRPAFEPRDGLDHLRFTLAPDGQQPPGMDRVPGGEVALEIPGLDHLPEVRLGDYLIDRTEVTNAQYKRFVDAGGYRSREYWRQPFVLEGRSLTWEQAISRLRDRTGRPGPAGWASGDFPEGQGDLPVTGVSWHEAAAYAAFAGKALPNLYQWSRAAGAWASARIVPASNFAGKGLAPVGSMAAIGPYGTRDMAGNAKEWIWNATGSRRYILGGAWNEPSYMFNDLDAQDPFARADNYGIRLVKPLDDKTAASAGSPVDWSVRDYSRERPVGVEVFRAYKRTYAYDKLPLQARAEPTSDDSDRWKVEKVSFTAAYGGERMAAFLFTPRHVPPPWQLVVVFPGSNAIHLRSSEQLTRIQLLRPLVLSGRAVLYPIFKSTYERGDALDSDYPAPTASYRDHVQMWARDLGRAIDWAETRRDLDTSRLALYGISWGAELAPLLVAVEERIKTGIMVGGGLTLQQAPPEADPFHFAPHLRQPMLMVNGRYDFFFPVDTTQLPLFKLLGSPAGQKRHVIFESGHVPPNDLLAREELDWLDRYLGPVK